MRRLTALWFVALALLCPRVASGQGAPQTPASGGSVVRVPTCATSLARDLYRFCFDGTKWNIDEPTNSRFTNRDRVEVEVQHFNFMKYTLSFDVKEEKSEAYQYLTKLATSIINPDIAGVLGALGLEAVSGESDEERRRKNSQREFLNHLRDLARWTSALDTKITGVSRSYVTTGLTENDVKRLSAEVGWDPAAPPKPAPTLPPCSSNWPSGNTDPILKCPVRQIIDGAADAYGTVGRGIATDTDQYDASIIRFKGIYDSAINSYKKVVERATAFIDLASKSAGKEVKQVGKREAGTRITLTLAGVDAGGGRTPMGDVSYFVETTMPIVLHGGLSFSSLHDVTFEKIQRASSFGEDDLFQQKSDATNSKNFSIFFGWQLFQLDPSRTPNESHASLLASIGTDIAAPGKKIFAGPSLLLFNRIVLTTGWAFGKEAHGEQQTLDPDIFKVIKEQPTSTWFFAFTTKVH